MELLKRNDTPQLQPKGCVRLLVNNTWRKKTQTCLCLLPASSKKNSLEQNPYIFDTFDLDGDDSAKLSTCRLQYGTSYFPELHYESDFKSLETVTAKTK